MFSARPHLVSITKCLLAVALLWGTAACGPREPAPLVEHSSAPMSDNRTPSSVSNKTRNEHPAWPLGEAILSASIASAKALDTATSQFLDAPDLDKLVRAQRQWRETVAAIEHFHLFSRLGTVAPQDYQNLLRLQFNITAWPIQPGYLDALGDYPYSGIVFDVGMPLTAEALREQHGMTDSSDASLGLYAMEFLLFGEGNNRAPLAFQPITVLSEVHKIDGYSHVDELPRNRRRALLRLQAQLLVEDITLLHKLWTGDRAGTVKHSFELLTPTQQAELLQKAALALATEQLVVVANQSGRNLWQGQQLADRLAAQLAGLARFNSVANLGGQVAATTADSLASLNAIRDLPPSQQQEPAGISWQESYTNLRELIKALNPAPPEAAASNSSLPL